MTTYNDAQGYKMPITWAEANDFVLASKGLSNVGFDDDTNSFAPIAYDAEGEFIDPGLRISFKMYGDSLAGRIEKKSRRIVSVEVMSGGDLNMKASGIYINMTSNRKVYCHWPSAQFGNQNHLMFAYDGEKVSMTPYIVVAFWRWIKECKSESENVLKWMEEHTNDPT